MEAYQLAACGPVVSITGNSVTVVPSSKPTEHFPGISSRFGWKQRSCQTLSSSETERRDHTQTFCQVYKSLPRNTRLQVKKEIKMKACIWIGDGGLKRGLLFFSRVRFACCFVCFIFVTKKNLKVKRRHRTTCDLGVISHRGAGRGSLSSILLCPG